MNHGANVNEVNAGGDSPLHYCVIFHRFDILKYLVRSCGADVNLINRGGDTPLYLACFRGSLESCLILLQSNIVDPNISNASGASPLHILSTHGDHGDLTRLLLDYGANVNAMNVSTSPLCNAIYFERRDIASTLIEYNANTSIPYFNGNSCADEVSKLWSVSFLQKATLLSKLKYQLNQLTEELAFFLFLITRFLSISNQIELADDITVVDVDDSSPNFFYSMSDQVLDFESICSLHLTAFLFDKCNI